MNEETKAVVCVSEMARMVGLSRQRFYQLMGTTFPRPLRAEETNRPYYTEEMQKVCIEVKNRNTGVDGKPVLFYATGHQPRYRKPVAKRKTPAKKKQYTKITNGLAALGLTSVTDQQVGAAIKQLFPEGIDGQQEGEILRAVFLFIKRQN